MIYTYICINNAKKNICLGPHELHKALVAELTAVVAWAWARAWRTHARQVCRRCPSAAFPNSAFCSIHVLEAMLNATISSFCLSSTIL